LSHTSMVRSTRLKLDLYRIPQIAAFVKSKLMENIFFKITLLFLDLQAKLLYNIPQNGSICRSLDRLEES